MSNNPKDLQNASIKQQIQQELQKAETMFQNGESLSKIFALINQKLEDVIHNQKSSMRHELFSKQDKPKEKILKSFAKYYYEGLGNYEKATEYYQKLNDQKVPPNILKGLGDCLRKRGKHSEAILKYEAALANIQTQQEEGEMNDEMQELEVSILNNKGLSHFALSKEKSEELDSAKKALEKALQKKNNNVLSLCNLGRVYIQQDEWTKALELFEKAVCVNSEEEESPNAIEDAEQIYFEKMLPKLINLTKDFQKHCEKFVDTIQFKALAKEIIHQALGLEEFADEFRERSLCQTSSENIQNISAQLTQEYLERFQKHEERISLLFTMSTHLLSKAEIQEQTILEFKKELSSMLVDWEKKINEEFQNEEDRKKLKNYFFALTETFSQVWITSQVIISDLIALSPPQFKWDMIQTLIKELPLIPSVLMKITQFKEVQDLKIFARRMSSLGSAVQVDKQIGQACFYIIKDPAYQIKILQVTEKDLEIFSQSVFEKGKSWLKRLAEKLDEKLYGELYRTPAAKLGHRDANLLVLRWINNQIADGKITEEFVSAILSQQDPYGAIDVESENSK